MKAGRGMLLLGNGTFPKKCISRISTVAVRKKRYVWVSVFATFYVSEFMLLRDPDMLAEAYRNRFVAIDDPEVEIGQIQSLLVGKYTFSREEFQKLKACNHRMEHLLDEWDGLGVPLKSRVLIVYHVGFLSEKDSFSLNEINIRLFLSSFEDNNSRGSTFLIVNVNNGDLNPLRRTVQEYFERLPEHCVLDWTSTESDMLTHSLTIGHLRDVRRFSSLFAMNQGVRGPLVKRASWIEDFQKLLEGPQVMLAGAVMSCEQMPHIQTHMFGLRTSFVSFFLHHQLDTRTKDPAQHIPSWSEIVSWSEVGLSQATIRHGYKIASLLHKNRWRERYFDGICRPDLGQRNPTGWCELSYNDTIFVKFGGEFYRQQLYCERFLTAIDQITSKIL
jgi:hypothetical protein